MIFRVITNLAALLFFASWLHAEPPCDDLRQKAQNYLKQIALRSAIINKQKNLLDPNNKALKLSGIELKENTDNLEALKKVINNIKQAKHNDQCSLIIKNIIKKFDEIDKSIAQIHLLLNKNQDALGLYEDGIEARNIYLINKAYNKALEKINKIGGPILVRALEKGDLSLVNMLLKNGLDINGHYKTLSEGALDVTPLYIASKAGNLSLLKWLIKHGADTNVPALELGQAGPTPLHIAAEKGYKNIVIELLRNNARPNVRDFFGATPLKVAQTHQQEEIVSELKRLGIFE